MTIPTKLNQATVQPIGTPIALETLMQLSNFTQADLDRAIGTANPRLRRYLKAKVRER